LFVIFSQSRGRCLGKAPIDPIQYYVAETLCVPLQRHFSYFYTTQTTQSYA
jgi:hypothetical protein